MQFLQNLYRCFTDLYFTYLEINPIGTTCTSHTHTVHLHTMLLCTYVHQCLYIYIKCSHKAECIQWDPSNPDTTGAERVSLLVNMSSFQWLKCIPRLGIIILGDAKGVLFREVSSFQGSLIDGCHCMLDITFQLYEAQTVWFHRTLCAFSSRPGRHGARAGPGCQTGLHCRVPLQGPLGRPLLPSPLWQGGHA